MQRKWLAKKYVLQQMVSVYEDSFVHGILFPHVEQQKSKNTQYCIICSQDVAQNIVRCGLSAAVMISLQSAPARATHVI